MRRRRNKSFRHRSSLAVLVLVVALSVCCLGCPRARDPQSYVEDLKSDSAENRERAVKELVRIGESAVPLVIKALQWEEPGARAAAVKVLTEVHTLEAFEAVAGLVAGGENHPDVLAEAARSLAKLGDLRKRRAIELLTIILRLGQIKSATVAAEGLVELHTRKSLDVLMQALESKEGLAAIFAARALYRDQRLRGASDHLLQNLSAQDRRIREAAQFCVEDLSITSLDNLLDHISRTENAAQAEGVLARIRKKLTEELSKKPMEKRLMEILVALGKIADEESVSELTAVASGEAFSIAARAKAADALGVAALSERTGPEFDDKIRASLENILQEEKADVSVRIGSAISLCKMRNRMGVDYLLHHLTAEEATSKEVRIEAQAALTASGDFVVPSLLKEIKSPEAGPTLCWAAAKTLGELRVKEAVPHLSRFLTGKITVTQKPEKEGEKPVRKTVPYPHYVRWTAAIALGQIGGQEALLTLRDALPDEKNAKVGFYIQRAIAQVTGRKTARNSP